MSAGLNRVTIIGNLGQKPELKYIPSGQPVCNFSVAVNEQWKSKDGEKQERTEWFRVQAWGKLGENCAQYLDKGRQVYIEGRLQTREYEKDGEKKYSTELVASEVKFLGGGKGDGESRAPSKPSGGGYGSGKKPSAPSGDPDFGPPGGDDDIPF